MLGAVADNTVYALQTPLADYAQIFYQSKAPVDFAAWLVRNAELKPTLSLEAMLSDYFVSTSLFFFIQITLLLSYIGDGCSFVIVQEVQKFADEICKENFNRCWKASASSLGQ
jgi:hypothetical protein